MYERFDKDTASTLDRIAFALCQIIDDDAPMGWTRYRGVAQGIAHNKDLMRDLEMLAQPENGMDKRAITCKECAMDGYGYAVLVRGNIVAWFPKFDEQEAEWCTNNHFGAWLIMKARQPVIVAPSKDAVESAEKCAAELSEILNDISQGEPLAAEREGPNIELAEDVAKYLGKAWLLGQDYWRQGDSESHKENKKAEETRRKFANLVEETRNLVGMSVGKYLNNGIEPSKWLVADEEAFREMAKKAFGPKKT